MPPVIENVQLRTFPRVEPPDEPRPDVELADGWRYDGSFWRGFQDVRELDLDRPGLLSGGVALREVGADEAKHSTFASHGYDPLDEAEHPSRARLDTCVSCHGASGVHSMISFTRVSSGPGTHLVVPLSQRPRALVADSADGRRTRALEAARASPQLARLVELWQATAGGGAPSSDR